MGFCEVVTAQKSLFIPGFDPQPISADVAGVDQEGRTTWILQPGVFSGSFDDSGFIGTGELDRSFAIGSALTPAFLSH